MNSKSFFSPFTALFAFLISSISLYSQVTVTDVYELLDVSTFTLNWSDNSGSNDDYLIVVKENTDVGNTTPSGDGSNYTASTTYGNGDLFATGYICYKGNGSSVTISGLTTNTEYYVKIYSRSGTSWSNAASYNFLFNPPVVGEVFISEYARNSISSYGYLEIYNSTANSINLSGSKIISSGSNNQVIDLKTDLHEAQITIPSNGFLILCRDRSKSNFENRWNVDLSNTGYTVNFNRTNINAFGNKNLFTLKLGGNEGVNDGITIDLTGLKPSNLSKRAFQLPIGYWASNEKDNTTATPGSFDNSDNFTVYKMTYVDGAWRVATGESYTQPNSTTGNVRIKILDSDVVINNASQLEEIYIDESYGIALTNESISATDIFLEEGAYIKITGSGNVAASGNIQIERTGYAVSDDYNLWGSPFSSDVGISNVFSDIAPCDVYGFKASTQEWKNDATIGSTVSCQGNLSTIVASNVIESPEGDPDGNFDVGRGYFIAGSSNNNRVFSATGGALNNGNINVNVYGSNGSVIDGSNDWNYIANPYPSALNADAFLTTNSALVQNVIYVYNPSGSSHVSNSFQSYNNTDNFNIASCQGFIVNTNTNTNGLVGSVLFTNSMRTEYNDDFRSNKNWYGVYLSITNNLFHSDQTRLYFSPNSKDGLDDEFDAYKMLNSEISLASKLEGTPMVFNGFSPLDSLSTVFPLHVQCNLNSPIIFSLDSLVNNPNIEVVLEDRLVGEFTTLNTDLYSINARPGTYDNRFFLHLKLADQSNSNNDELTLSVADILEDYPSIYVSNKILNYSSNSEKKFSTIKVYTTDGKTLVNQTTMGSSGSIELGYLPEGIYILHATLEGGKHLTRKIVL